MFQSICSPCMDPSTSFLSLSQYLFLHRFIIRFLTPKWHIRDASRIHGLFPSFCLLHSACEQDQNPSSTTENHVSFRIHPLPTTEDPITTASQYPNILLTSHKMASLLILLVIQRSQPFGQARSSDSATSLVSQEYYLSETVEVTQRTDDQDDAHVVEQVQELDVLEERHWVEE
ncbi:hypothetical protein DL95DRAFT_390018 [Leptodontidium sp. 2 PMI_412]|nr:hypothetical protein DL95DRAFT_390018 [Leptodontidium sp. 2 PMI_412]